MKVLIIGAGLIGVRLAKILEQRGHQICVVDHDPTALRSLGDEFRGITVQGLGYDQDILKKAGIEECDVVFAVTNNDNANIVAGQLAKFKFGRDRVVIRVHEPEKGDVYRAKGLGVISTTALVVDAFLAHLDQV